MLIANARHAQPLLNQTDREPVYRPLQFHKGSQLFIRPHNVAAVAVQRKAIRR
jgi:hypothetical protein